VTTRPVHLQIYKSRGDDLALEINHSRSCGVRAGLRNVYDLASSDSNFMVGLARSIGHDRRVCE
jgi:hypothetical protein